MIYLVNKVVDLNETMQQVFLSPKNDAINYLPGQYLNIIPEGFEARPFSIANAPKENGEMELHIRYIPIPYSQQLSVEIQSKKQIEIDGPLGLCVYQQDCDRPIIFMAGGVGFAPIKAIIEAAIENNDQRPMFLYWGAKTEEDLYLNELAKSWAKTIKNFKYIPVLSEPHSDTYWQGHVGLVHEVVAADFPDLSNYQLYASGPPEMVFAGKELFLKQGLDERLIYSDLF